MAASLRVDVFPLCCCFVCAVAQVAINKQSSVQCRGDFRSALVDRRPFQNCIWGFPKLLFFVCGCVWWQLVGYASYHCLHKAWPSFPPRRSRASPHLCRGWTAPVGHLASGGDAQTPDQHQRTEALLLGDGRELAGPDGVGEEAVLVPRALAQRGRSADDRASGAAGCKPRSSGRLSDGVCVCVC